MNERCFRSGLFCISDKCGEHSRFIKIITQLPCRDGACPVGCEIGQSSSAFLDGNATAEKFFSEVLIADSIGKRHADFFTKLAFVRFKLGLLNGQALFGKNSVFFIQRKSDFNFCTGCVEVKFALKQKARH